MDRYTAHPAGYLCVAIVAAAALTQGGCISDPEAEAQINAAARAVRIFGVESLKVVDQIVALEEIASGLWGKVKDKSITLEEARVKGKEVQDQLALLRERKATLDYQKSQAESSLRILRENFDIPYWQIGLQIGWKIVLGVLLGGGAMGKFKGIRMAIKEGSYRGALQDIIGLIDEPTGTATRTAKDVRLGVKDIANPIIEREILSLRARKQKGPLIIEAA